MFCSPLQPMWDLTIHPPWGPASSLAHHPVSSSNTTCNSSITPLGRYCPLWAFPSRASPQGFKTCLLGRGFHTLIRNVLFPSLTDVGSHNPPIEGQHPRWHTARCPALLPFVTTKPTATKYCPLWAFPLRDSPQGFKTRRLGRGFHTLIRNVLFPSPIDVGSHRTC